MSTEQKTSPEEGQAIVLIALMIVGIIAFVGLAADVGFLFARSSQWSAAVDAAALAGVADLDTGETEAELRARQFLAANGWPTDTVSSGARFANEYGIPEFAFTATLPVETFFLRILAFDDIALTHSATAASYSLVDMPTATQEERGMIKQAGQFIIGQAGCTQDGEPVSPLLAGPDIANEFLEVSQGRFDYRIRIPADYPGRSGQNIVRVQLFDPDPHNNYLAGDTVTTFHPDGTTTSEYKTCAFPLDFSKECVLETGEPDNRNPLWLVRVDKPYHDACGGPKSHDPLGNTITTWRLYFFDANGEEYTIASYTFDKNTAFDLTDLKWVTPGVTAGVATDGGGSFDVDITNPLGDGTTIGPDNEGDLNLFLEVTAENGASLNTWDLWAGPPAPANAANSDQDSDGVVDANDRNLYLLRHFVEGSTKDVRIFALGRLPVNSYRTGETTLPVGSVAPDAAGSDLYVTVFDLDEGAGGDNSDQLTFYYDIFGEPSRLECSSPEPLTCDGGSCDNRWLAPVINASDKCPVDAASVEGVVPVPINEDQATPDWTFFGGDLVARYTPNADEHVWSTLISKGTPFLTD